MELIHPVQRSGSSNRKSTACSQSHDDREAAENRFNLDMQQGRKSMNCQMNAGKSLAVDILIYYRDLGYVRGRICDIAAEGMCIDMRPVMLPDDKLVELAVTIPGDKGDRFYRVQAFVAHAADGVVGLIFYKRDDHNVRSLLRAIVKVAQERQAAEGMQREEHGTQSQALRA